MTIQSITIMSYISIHRSTSIVIHRSSYSNQCAAARDRSCTLKTVPSNLLYKLPRVILLMLKKNDCLRTVIDALVLDLCSWWNSRRF
ncbi:hypothetical protein Ccrd_017176 [Cynara cardunculus var. scolymus]|uniref:Uncharacterized protein n=1 Tax=Cynara cardunculus var. scolymus TaxID=59895 RepID=A0A103Y8K5_CYNCS|nr:hypothetical protein Ccrd_017176 [Cynara cardunculus var. scolymus]